jgi:hypothetical protein
LQDREGSQGDDVGEGRGRDRGLIGLDVGPQRRGGWLDFDSMARAKARFGPDSAQSKDRVRGPVVYGLFGLWALLKRRKG